MPSRLIDDLDPRIRESAHAIRREWKAKGLDVLITCTYRSPAEQDALYAQGRTKPGPIVTQARAGESMHNVGLAIDFVPKIDGRVTWNDQSKLWEVIARLAQGIDSRVVWGGDWSARIRDRPHLEWRLPKETA